MAPLGFTGPRLRGAVGLDPASPQLTSSLGTSGCGAWPGRGALKREGVSRFNEDFGMLWMIELLRELGLPGGVNTPHWSGSTLGSSMSGRLLYWPAS